MNSRSGYEVRLARKSDALGPDGLPETTTEIERFATEDEAEARRSEALTSGLYRWAVVVPPAPEERVRSARFRATVTFSTGAKRETVEIDRNPERKRTE